MLTRLVYLVIVLIVGAAITLLFRLPQLGFIESGALTILSPVQSLLDRPIRLVQNTTEVVRSISDLQEENSRLQAEVAQLRSELALAEELRRENEHLREQLGLRTSQPSYQLLPARIIGYDTSSLVRSLIINRGSRDGMAEGMTVVTAQGLAGKVVKVNWTTAKVLLITDVSSSVNGLVQDSRARGVVMGGPAGQLTMRYITQGERVVTGDRVITSGLGGFYPEGFVIGSITDVRQKDIDMFQEARLEPAVDFDRLETVLIILNHLPLSLEEIATVE